ncbi:putative uncharacterized protein BRD3OS isoform X1 [Myotis myotis]|uniref:putative uncharacterized protein BRD3OS isoform X1 n=1 Tax=Myotis myotis TaxID=51298 RepID=UPI001749AEE0|nr:putative uncharacterized protein BRD3OS isoform X1 [Myotis myotis]
MAPAHRAGLPALGARLGMPAVLPWRRGPAAHWHSLGLRLAPARASRRPHGAGDRTRAGSRGRGPRMRGGDGDVPGGGASGCLEQKEGAGAGRVPGGPQPAAQDHLGEAPQTSLTRSTERSWPHTWRRPGPPNALSPPGSRGGRRPWAPPWTSV